MSQVQCYTWHRIIFDDHSKCKVSHVISHQGADFAQFLVYNAKYSCVLYEKHQSVLQQCNSFLWMIGRINSRLQGFNIISTKIHCPSKCIVFCIIKHFVLITIMTTIISAAQALTPSLPQHDKAKLPTYFEFQLSLMSHCNTHFPVWFVYCYPSEALHWQIWHQKS